ncbi:hypothetical protein KAR91_45495 [Candidatus Pacearchaeota archaeon]|nr:hypothetical protein [Candidatus Pacearchaeota archaeon]
MELDVIKMLINQGGGYLLAGVIFWFYQKNVTGLLRETKKIIKENTEAMQEIKTVVEFLAKR